MVLSILIFAVFRYFLVFKYAYYFFDIYGDGFYSNYPSICGVVDYVHKNIIPAWSFKVGMGQNIFTWLFKDPFDVIYYLGGSNHVLQLTIYSVVLKVLISGIIFHRYLKVVGIEDFTAIAGAVFFAFCGFNLEGSAWFTFSYEVFNFALLLLATELVLCRGKWLLFPIAVFLTAISTPINLYLYGSFLAIYVLLRLRELHGYQFAKWISVLTLFAGLTLCGVLLSGPMLLPIMDMLQHSPRAAMKHSFAAPFTDPAVFYLADPVQLGSAIQRFFSNDIMGSGSGFKGWDTILGSPLFYCGVIWLVLMPQVWWNRSEPGKKKYAWLLLVLLLPTLLPYFRHAIWFFTGDYYRGYSFLVSFSLLLTAAFALDDIVRNGKVNKVVLLVTAAVLLGAVIFHPFLPKICIETDIQLLVIGLIIGYTLIFFFLDKFRKRSTGVVILSVVMISELYFAGYVSVNKRDAFQMNWLLHDKVMYRNSLLDAANIVNNRDHTFFRADKNFVPVTARYTDLNASQYQGYNSTSAYSSFNQLGYIRFLQLTGVADSTREGDARWAVGLYERPVVEALSSVKYFFAVDSFQMREPFMWDTVCHTGNVMIWQNKFALPLGYLYHRYINKGDYLKLDSTAKTHTLCRALVLNDGEDLRPAEMEQLTGQVDSIPDTSLLRILKADTLAIQHFDDNHIAGYIHLDQPGILYLSVPFDDGWVLEVNGKTQKKLMVNGGMTGMALDAGDHNISMAFHVRYLGAGIMCMLAGIMLLSGYYVYLRLRKRGNP